MQRYLVPLRHKIHIQLVVITSLLFFSAPAMGGVNPWIKPAIPAQVTKDREIIVVERYKYDQVLFDPYVQLTHPIHKFESSSSQVNKAFVSRLSAVMRADYDWFLSSWDQKSRLSTISRDQSLGRTREKMVGTWRGIFSQAHIAMIRKVKYGNYVIITYNVVDSKGKDVGNGMEFPTIFYFNKARRNWLATQDLARDTLLILSPWVTGASHMDVVVR